ncbi:hypothetical protein DDV21_010380 [Streptococcus chenjunshii]|uniref:Uncharacterized protein n=1 Tax=Streptococcus chenjunshii TaxID=2173853 RepID=A0A372KNP4_9STRE|nr:hypothetical protein [Streptococcus chenjunshii]AXQ79452.1 hypothetical protein DDV21_010380 [Streptococcus chenjunshii]RFU51090.1 hypothetical protein DDV22_05120 [Streptococcus chenjunshii]RFU53188.1 hypothetical protein DDV23_05630 [Streptococcus chenjunshii]
MDSKTIQTILNKHNVDNSENLANALAEVLKRFSSDTRAAEDLSKSIAAYDRTQRRLRGEID